MAYAPTTDTSHGNQDVSLHDMNVLENFCTFLMYNYRENVTMEAMNAQKSGHERTES